MSIFSIGYPDIPWRALSVSASTETGFPVSNLYYGGSNLIWKRSSTATSTNITFDMGVGKSTNANYCFLRGIKHTVALAGGAANCRVEIRASTDNFSGSNVLVAEQNPIVLVGSRLEDAIIPFALSADYRYWRVVIITTGAVQHKLRKLFLGVLYNFDNNLPIYPYSQAYQNNSKPFVADNGSMFKTSNGRKQRAYTFNWRNVTDFERSRFQQLILEKKDDSPIFLYYDHNTGYHDPLSSQTVITAWIDNFNINPGDENKDLNSVQLRLIEDIY